VSSRSEKANGQEIAIELIDVTKRFPGVLANDRISLAFRRGEVHALLGENGAGKSTLISIMSGMQRPDSGQVIVSGRPAQIDSPLAALRLGIGTVYQHVLLVPSQTVLENLMLGAPWWRPTNRAATLKRFEELKELLSTNVLPDALVGRLSLGQQQQVEIMRALWHGELVLILDEPTSMLTPQGVRELGIVVRRLRDHGVAVIFITHKLKEAYELADRVSVLRLGRVVGELTPEELKTKSEQDAIDAVVAMMFGREEDPAALKETLLGSAIEHGVSRPLDRDGPPVLSLSDCRTAGAREECPLDGVSFDVWPGEVLGIAGVDGNGQKHLAETLAGQRGLEAGTITLAGEEVQGTNVVQRRARGVRYITDERMGEGTAASHSVATNLILKEIGKAPFWRGGITKWGQIHEHARQKIEAHDIRSPSERTAIAKLSGGNIQKVLLAREWAPDAKLVIFNKPTYGLDLQNTTRAREWIRNGAGAPEAALVVISNELDELIEVSHRIAVIDRGRIAGVVETRSGVEEEIGRLMTGAEAA